MAPARNRDTDNPILNSPYEEPRAHYATDAAGNPKLKAIAEDDWNIPTAEEDEAVYQAFMRAQEGSLRRFWDETRNDNL